MSGLSMGRIGQLDGIRAIAIVIVLLAHAGLEGIVPGGFGVTIFFFLSGYLITSQLRWDFASTGQVSLANFYLRRTLRILPPLYVTLMFAWLLVATHLVALRAPLDPFAVLAQCLFFQNYTDLWAHGAGLPITSVWSLAVEEHFYLIFPVFYLTVLCRRTPARAAACCLAICVIVLGIRCADVMFLADFSGNYQWSHTRIDSILFGSCLALYRNPVLDQGTAPPGRWQPILGLGLLLISLLIRNPVFRETLRYSLQAVALYMLFRYVLSTSGMLLDVLASRPARIVARYSYTLYLVHIPFMLLATTQLRLPHALCMLAAIGMAFLYAMGMYRMVERPAVLLGRGVGFGGRKKGLLF